MGKHAIILLSIITPFWSNFVLKLKIQFVFKSEENKIRLILSKSWFSYNIGFRSRAGLVLGIISDFLHFVADQPLNYCM